VKPRSTESGPANSPRIIEGDPVLVDDDHDLWIDASFLARIQGVVDQLLDGHDRPVVDAVADLRDEFLFAAKSSRRDFSKVVRLSVAPLRPGFVPDFWSRVLPLPRHGTEDLGSVLMMYCRPLPQLQFDRALQ